MRAQVKKSEELLNELERISAELNQVREEKEQTLEKEKKKERVSEQFERQMQRAKERAETMYKSVKMLERVIIELCDRHIIQAPP